MNKILKVVFCLFSPVVLFAQTPSNNPLAYNNKLKNLLNNQITEKVYLHFDKPYYVAGDTIYFKAYVTLGGQHIPSKLSGVLHVDLLNTANTVDHSLKLQIINGVGNGDFALADTLRKGNYRVRAYTRWMRNIDDSFFEKVIPIGSLKNNNIKLQAVAAKAGAADIRFFPEGGEMLVGVNSKVAFKAIDAGGTGIDLKGIITDEANNEVGRFASSHLGMGVFSLMPVAGKVYSAKVNYADGTQSTIALPKAKTDGLLLIANNDSLSKISLNVIANKAYFEKSPHQEFNVKVVSGGKVTSFKGKLDYEVMRFDIQKKNLRTGIAQITLYSATGEPLSERLVFVQSPDLLTLDLKSDQAEYTPRGRVTLSIRAGNKANQPIAGNFSVAVTDESKVPVDENSESTILSNLLLTSDLKGFVEQPNYYFVNNEPERLHNLDVLLLTQGYRNYVWKPQADSLVKYPPEVLLQIAGKLKSFSGKQLVANGKLSLISPEGGPVLSQNSDAQGGFNFPNLMFAGYTKFVVNGTTAKGDNNVKISIDKETSAPVTSTVASVSPTASNDIDTIMAAYLKNSNNQQEDIRKYGAIGGIVLKEVKIEAKQITKEPAYRTQSYAGAGNADQVIHMKDIKITGQLSDVLMGRLGGVAFFKGRPTLMTSGDRAMMIIVDGLILNNSGDISSSSIDQILASDVETVELLKYASTSIYGMSGAGGVLIITTKRGTGLELADIESKGVFPVVINGFYKAREFYTPKYDIDAAKKPNADLRTTVFWKPNVITDKDGNAAVQFYNADGSGTYRVVIEGIDDKGSIGRQVYRYKVN
ncbi:TonB-dependent receptor plug domain-containing protein [Mucilaginibacter glaciei]|uniref:TonB-dependent receptor plug domain-containing protein n=1 Tax=Mucilaginibacter glaciei TaxID=2772109 RepID=A0A926RZE1_9SPHI|nr:TonB-dependent receptor plug domain-containing protein [Mucilaginibacter glaciei]MBD1391765.1 TonB-dependent receptor plug domain-containing protein [Mucilaginibacter glaciei]